MPWAHEVVSSNLTIPTNFGKLVYRQNNSFTPNREWFDSTTSYHFMENRLTTLYRFIDELSIKVENKIKKNKMLGEILYHKYDKNLLVYILIGSITLSIILTFL